MKIKKTINLNKKLIQLQILKLHYKKKSYYFQTYIKKTELNLNKILNIIYNYHIHKKKILFIGFPKNFGKVLKNTQHTLIPEYKWLNGMLSNRNLNTSIHNVEKNKQATTLKLQKKLDLILYNWNEKSTITKESQLLKIPTITFEENEETSNIQPNYKTSESFELVSEKIPNNNFFFSTILTTLKKALRTKKINYYKTNEDLKNFYQGNLSWNTKPIRTKFFKKKKASKKKNRYANK